MIKKNIAHSFGRASQTYEQEAPVQKWTALQLRDVIAQKDLKDISSCLEIGCGTGFLTREMIDLYPKSKWVITDLSNEMLTVCQKRVGDVGQFLVMDGEHPHITEHFDLIVSSLAVQWFYNLEDGLRNLTSLLTPGGRLVVTTLGKRSFSEWRENLQNLDLPIGLHDYPQQEDICAFEIENATIKVNSVLLNQDYINGLAFLRALKTIGAHRPQATYKPMSSADMRRAIRALENNGDCAMTYEVLFIEVKKSA